MFRCVSSSRQRSSWNIHVNRISPAISLQNSREEASEGKVWHQQCQLQQHAWIYFTRFISRKKLSPRNKKQLFITSLIGLINLCNLRKAAELERNLNCVMQVWVQHEIEVPVSQNFSPCSTQLRTGPGISPDNVELIPVRWVVSPGNSGGTVTL